MTATEIEVWELTIPDEVETCWVFATYPPVCPDGMATWMVTPKDFLEEYPLCNGCKERWESFGTVASARLIKE